MLAQFQGLQTMVIWILCFWAAVKQNIKAEGLGGRKLFISWWSGRREQREEARGKTSFKDMPLNDLLYTARSTF